VYKYTLRVTFLLDHENNYCSTAHTKFFIMTASQCPINPTPEHDAIYEEALKTGTVHPSVLEHEETSLREARGPAAVVPTEHDYEDKHVLLSAEKRQLILKHWIIVHPVLVIDIDKIVWIHPAPGGVAGLGCHAWGMGLTGIGWARDFHRMIAHGEGWQHSFVCKYEHPSLGLRAGFTIEDPAKFVETLEKILPGVTTRPIHEKEREGLHVAPKHVGYAELEGDREVEAV